MNKHEMRRKAIADSLRLAQPSHELIGFMTGTPSVHCLTCGHVPPCQCPPVRTTLREQLAKALRG